MHTNYIHIKTITDAHTGQVTILDEEPANEDKKAELEIYNVMMRWRDELAQGKLAANTRHTLDTPYRGLPVLESFQHFDFSEIQRIDGKPVTVQSYGLNARLGWVDNGTFKWGDILYILKPERQPSFLRDEK